MDNPETLTTLRSQDTGRNQTNKEKRMKNIYRYIKMQKKNKNKNKTQHRKLKR